MNRNSKTGTVIRDQQQLVFMVGISGQRQMCIGKIVDLKGAKDGSITAWKQTDDIYLTQFQDNFGLPLTHFQSPQHTVRK